MKFLLPLFFSCLALGQITLKFDLQIDCKLTDSTKPNNVTCTAAKPVEKSPDTPLMPVDPVKPVLPPVLPTVNPTVPPPTRISATLQPIAYSSTMKHSDVRPTLKAGESWVNEYGVTETRLTDSTTGPGNVLAHFYANKPPLCGDYLVYMGLGGGTNLLNVRTNVSRPLNYQAPTWLALHSYQWNPSNCNEIFFTGGRFNQTNWLELWKYQVAENSWLKVQDYSAEVLAAVPGKTGMYLAFNHRSYNGDKLAYAVETGSKAMHALLLVDSKGTRAYAMNPLPAQYQPQQPANFKAAGLAGCTRESTYCTVHYNGIPTVPGGANSMGYVIAWDADPRTYLAYGTAGTAPTYHNAYVDGGVVVIHATGKVGLPMIPAENPEDCATPFPACTGSPIWWHSLRRYDFNGTPTITDGYPYLDTFAYALIADGYHLSSSPDGKVIASSTYQSVHVNGYLTTTPYHNELFVSYLDTGVVWNPAGGPFVKPANTRTVRLATLPTKPWESDGYWAQPHCSWDNTGTRLVCTIGAAGRVDTWMYSGFTQP
jgi:hypothetical protein